MCFICITRNTHAHLCLVPVHRLCADYACASYAGAGEARVARYVCCRRSCLVFVASKQWWPRCTVVPDLRLHQKRMPRHPRSTTSIWVKQTVKRTYGLHLWYVSTFHVTFPSVTHHVGTYVLCENRSLIQSLVLMCSAITCVTVKFT